MLQYVSSRIKVDIIVLLLYATNGGITHIGLAKDYRKHTQPLNVKVDSFLKLKIRRVRFLSYTLMDMNFNVSSLVITACRTHGSKYITLSHLSYFGFS